MINFQPSAREEPNSVQRSLFRETNNKHHLNASLNVKNRHADTEVCIRALRTVPVPSEIQAPWSGTR